jgi:hypothetical protein
MSSTEDDVKVVRLLFFLDYRVQMLYWGCNFYLASLVLSTFFFCSFRPTRRWRHSPRVWRPWCWGTTLAHPIVRAICFDVLCMRMYVYVFVCVMHVYVFVYVFTCVSMCLSAYACAECECDCTAKRWTSAMPLRGRWVRSVFKKRNCVNSWPKNPNLFATMVSSHQDACILLRCHHCFSLSLCHS